MVSQGQFLERPAIIPVGDCVLDGLWHRGSVRPPLLIVPPPPSEGSMQHPVLAEIAWAAAQSDFPTLRFDFRGVSASQGTQGDPAERLTDAEAALRLLEENTGTARVAVASFGASAQTVLALQRRHASVAGLCFVSPAGLQASDLTRVSVPILLVLGEGDSSTPAAALAAAVGEANGRLETVAGADRNFDRNLPQVGKAVARWLLDIGAR